MLVRQAIVVLAYRSLALRLYSDPMLEPRDGGRLRALLEKAPTSFRIASLLVVSAIAIFLFHAAGIRMVDSPWLPWALGVVGCIALCRLDAEEADDDD